MKAPRLVFLLLIAISVVASLHAEEKLPTVTLPAAQIAAQPEETPTTLPGTEAFIYRDADGVIMRLFVLKPKGWQASDRRAALIFFFGGGWTRGTPANGLAWARNAAELGMIGIAPDYRTNARHGTSPLASVADGRAALRWVQAHATELGLDPKKIVVGGNSAGGHVALWTGITPTPPGSSAKENPLYKPAALFLTSGVSDTSSETGYTPQRFGADATALSPVHQLDTKMPLVLAFHGDADKTVPLAQSLALRDKLTATGNICELHVVPGGSHNYGGDLPEWWTKTKQLFAAFVRERGLLTP